MPSQKPDIIPDPDNEVLAPTEDLSKPKNLPPASKKKFIPIVKINRFNIGAMILIQVLLAFICVCLLNYLTSDKHVREDLTAGAQYTLSDYSLKFLQGEQLKNHSDPIKIFVISKQNLIYSQRLRSLFEEYSRNSTTEIDVEFIDRVKDANRLNEISAIYSKSFHEDSVMIDARTDAEKTKLDTPNTTSLTSNPNETETLPVSLKRIRQFPIHELFRTSEDGSRITAWQDEKIITTYLLSAVEGKARKFYFIVDKSEVDDLGEGSPAWRTFNSLLNSQNIELEPYQISSNKPIPSDAEGVAIIGLDVDFDDNEIQILNEYWGRNSASMFITIKPEAKLVKIRRFLASYGIMVENDRVTSMNNGRKFTTARGIFVRGNEITKGFGDQATQLDGMTRSLSLVNVDQLATKNINVYSILNSAPGWWGEASYQKDKAQFDPGIDNGSAPESPVAKPVSLSAAVVRGKLNLDRTKHLTSRMIVMGNTQFLRPNNMRDELTHFMVSSINWLAGREELVGSIGQKPVQNQKITIPENQKSQINFTILGILPSLAAITAFFVWFNRRS
ncbi:MAG: hypothetical protein ACSHX6_13800 [Akkermansiaceae bacterium]